MGYCFDNPERCFQGTSTHIRHCRQCVCKVGKSRRTRRADCVGHLIWSIMAERCLHDWCSLFDVHRGEGHRPELDHPKRSDMTPAPFLRAASCISYIVVLSHTIDLPRVFMSLTRLKNYTGCKHSWCPSEISVLIILEHPHVWQERLNPAVRAVHSLISCMPSYCAHSCVCVRRVCGRCMQNGGLFVDRNSFLWVKHSHAGHSGTQRWPKWQLSALTMCLHGFANY